MWKICAIVLLAVVAYAGAADARGGGAEPMPQFGYTDLPPYHPKPAIRYFKHMHCCWRHLNTTHPN